MEHMMVTTGEGKPFFGQNHTVCIEGRNQASVTGVTDLMNFNEAEVAMMTEAGVLTVLGEDLHITQLSLEEGKVSIAGRVDAMEYTQEPQAKRGWFKR